ncbi:FAD-binding protein [Zhihengliuella alba]|uniref:FAD-binding protein n=1 Tax=Zhihengliuella alba TaxID=547018 RepID=A0ABP7D5V9_9MICC
MQPSETNWAGNLAYRAGAMARPSSREELLAALAGEGELRVVGSRHSFNTITDTAGTLVSAEDLPAGIEIAADRRSVGLGGGVRYGDLAVELARHGLALANLASLPHISVAGAIATGTHGSGDRLGSLATSVRALTFLAPDGAERTYRRGDEDFAGAVVHLGALGVVVRVELDVEPAYQVVQTVFESLDWATVVENFDAVTGCGTSVSLFTSWGGTGGVDQIWVKDRADAPAGNAAAVLAGLGARPADGPRHPLPGGDTRASTEQLGLPGLWSERLPHFRLAFTPSSGDELQSEYFLPREAARAAIARVQALGPRLAPLVQVSELRTVRADDLWLSPAYGQDVVAFHFTWRPDQPAVEALLPELEAALGEGVRAHWGKLWQLDPASVAGGYERWDDFVALQRRHDPQGRFVNDFLRRLGL